MRKLLHFLRDMLIIRRVEFRIAELPIVAMPALLVNTSLAPLQTQTFWEGVLLFFFLFAFGDMINCLADRDLDAKYKPHLSRAVYNLGVPFVTWQVILWAALALAIAAHVSWMLHRWQLLALTAAGLALGAAYSIEPFRLKGRGLAQLVCLWLIIFVGPMLMIATLFGAWPSRGVVAFAMAYGAVQMGIILVNTAEDYPEDRDAGVHTVIVTLGLVRGIGLASALTLLGAAGMLVTLAALYVARAVPSFAAAALLPVTAACIWLTRGIYRLYREVAASSLDAGIAKVKLAAKNVPAWVTVVAWTALAAVAVLFLYSSKLH
ncbi:MAG TPA: UbiA family prenyltransferase [Candidatus Acidoferrum sp.]|nr:UbiA family prenyltransferase [Candidatus Acidoferrum sp.]